MGLALAIIWIGDFQGKKDKAFLSKPIEISFTDGLSRRKDRERTKICSLNFLSTGQQKTVLTGYGNQIVSQNWSQDDKYPGRLSK